MGNEFPHLFSPFAVGGMTIKNRLVALPAGTSMAENGVPTHGDTEHFQRLAAGGVGLIIGGATVVHPTTTLRSRKLVEAYIDEFVPATAAKVEVIHRHGAKFIGQLCHLGREFIGGESDAPPSAPSPIKTPRDAYPLTNSRLPRSKTLSKAGASRPQILSRQAQTARKSMPRTVICLLSSCPP